MCRRCAACLHQWPQGSSTSAGCTDILMNKTTCLQKGSDSQSLTVVFGKCQIELKYSIILCGDSRTVSRTAYSQSHRRCIRRRKCTASRSEEHTSELQSHHDLVCRLLLEKK